MLFNSIEFILFFILVLIVYYALPHRFRWVLLLLSSYYFYMAWKPVYILLIFLSTGIDYFAAMAMGRQKEQRKRKKYLYLSLFANLGLLFFFKYWGFFKDSVESIAGILGVTSFVPSFSMLLPMGISFYTFQTLSYTIDVYRGRRKPERHFGIFALYVTFFPQLVAGPIERSDRLIPQFYEHHTFDYERVTDGLKRMAIGYFKKVVIADRLAIAVNTVYNNPVDHDGVQMCIATVFFMFQIYCDFSGYSDIAIGAAQTMGFKLMENFRRPFFSKTISEFWERWHISLGSWLKDYVFIPLGGNRVRKSRHYFNLFVTFAICGLWHGARWTFVVFGCIHGFFIVIENMTREYRVKLEKKLNVNRMPLTYKVACIGSTFGLVCFAEIFFRANSMGDAVYIIKHLFTGWGQLLNHEMAQRMLLGMGLDKMDLCVVGLSIVLMEIMHLLERRESIINRIKGRPTLLRWGIYYSMILYIIFMGVFNLQEFIYFQF